VVGAVGAALVTGTLTACSGDGPAAGTQRIETGWLRVDVPADWVAAGPVSDIYTESYQDAPGDDATVQLALAPEYGFFTASMGVARAMATLQVSGRTGFHRIDAIDADDTSLRDHIAFSYTGDDGQEYEGVLWGVADEDQHVALLQLTGQHLDQDLIVDIDRSIVVDGKGATTKESSGAA